MQTKGTCSIRRIKRSTGSHLLRRSVCIHPNSQTREEVYVPYDVLIALNHFGTNIRVQPTPFPSRMRCFVPRGRRIWERIVYHPIHTVPLEDNFYKELVPMSNEKYVHHCLCKLGVIRSLNFVGTDGGNGLQHSECPLLLDISVSSVQSLQCWITKS